jgi:hypothetical protein
MCRMHTVDLLERKCSSTPHTEKAFLMQSGALKAQYVCTQETLCIRAIIILTLYAIAKKNLCHNLGSLKVK